MFVYIQIYPYLYFFLEHILIFILYTYIIFSLAFMQALTSISSQRKNSVPCENFVYIEKNVFSICVSFRLQCLQMKYKGISRWFLELANKGHLWSASLSCRMHLCGCQPNLGVGLNSLCNVIVVFQLS